MIVDILLFAFTTDVPPGPAPQGGGSSDVFVAALASGGVGAVLAAIVTGAFSKRKLGAEATNLITQAAAGIVSNLQAELERQIRRVQAIETEHEEQIRELNARHEDRIREITQRYERQMDDNLRVLQLHVAWGIVAIAKLEEAGIEIDPPPRPR